MQLVITMPPKRPSSPIIIRRVRIVIMSPPRQILDLPCSNQAGKMLEAPIIALFGGRWKGAGRQLSLLQVIR
jgi:hypothetical protein